MLKASLTRLRPRDESLVECIEAFANGDFHRCIDGLSENGSLEALILRARAYIRVGDAEAAIDSLRADLTDASHEVASEALAVKSYAFAVLRRLEDRDRIAVEARARCFSTGLKTIEAELCFATAVGAMLESDIDGATIAIDAIHDLVDDTPSWIGGSSYGYSLHYWRARACDLRAGIELLGSNYEGQAAWMRRAFDEFDKSGVHDEQVHAGLVANYADAATKTSSAEITAYAVSRADMVKWQPELSWFEFRVFSALAEAASASGDQVGALRFFRRCLDCAPTPALQMRASVERARLLREIGESLSSREELEHAVRVSRTIDWEATTLIDQRQLILLAGQIAHFDAKQAERLVSRFDGLKRNASNVLAIRDESFRGEEFAARAAVMRALGNSERAVLLLVDAFETFTNARLAAKAALVAAELAALTGEESYAEIARTQATKQPKSILARKLSQTVLRDVMAKPDVLRQALPSNVIAFARPKLALLS